jgi:hypothetical protein
MYWLGIVGSTLTYEQRILAQRSSLGQPHPPQKFRAAAGHAQRSNIAVERVAAASSRVFRDEAGTSAFNEIPRLGFQVCINDVRRAAHPQHEAAKQQ